MAKESSDLTRRNFLTISSAAALAGGAALAGYTTAMADEAEEDTAAEEEADEAEAEESTEEEAASTEAADETKECDIAIVGAGGAGMWAAVEACRAGKSVVVVEKGEDVGVSNGSSAGGPMIVESKMQQEAGIDFTVDVAFQHVMEYGHWYTNAPAIRKAIELSGETIDQFTDDFGVPTYLRPDNYNAGYDSIRAGFKDDDGNSYSGVDRMGPLQDWTEENGAEYIFNTTGKSLIMEDGVCKGVQCEEEDGSILTVNASAVIVCTGGFLGNSDMMLEKFGTYVNPLGNTLSIGEGIDMVAAVGGQLSTQWGIAGNEFCGSNQKASGALYGLSNDAAAIGIYGTLLVNNQGRRFSNEGKFANYPLALGGAISMLGGQYYAIVDQAYIDGLASGVDAWTWCGSDSENWYSGMMTLQDEPLENLEEDLATAMEEGWAFSGETIEELAETIGAPDLAETVETYNGYCETGEDEQFYKPACFLQPITTAPYYALQFEPSAWVTIGGIRTNDRLQPVDAEGMPIEGVYVAGADNGTLMAAPYTDYEGYSLMCAYNGGRMAGMYAAEDIDA